MPPGFDNGASTTISSICRNKASQRKLLKDHHIPSPDSIRVTSEKDLEHLSFTYPVIIKPATAASSSHVYLGEICLTNLT
ncbi:hypothetical protein [Bacillus changyiensis]|uniref:hypothetical protein n=1 Tax=Bacillus changyiensis TaxID=3004103 RepID=UPI0022E00781|nr:hypothetical protein [Bacillus changyiensis]MDA1478000.1 hypothetical protein [Bacillus changyiensis]